MGEIDDGRYRVQATHRRRSIEFTVKAPDSKKAVAQARRMGKACGMNRILVHRVTELDDAIIEYTSFYGAPLIALGGEAGKPPSRAGNSLPTGIPSLSVKELNTKIGDVWDRLVVFTPKPDHVQLKAYELDGRVFLDDGVSGRQELCERSSFELAMLLYEWITFAGYYCDDFSTFVEDYWT